MLDPKGMTTSTLIWVIGIWLFFNAVFPLLLNSFERLYQPQIDTGVRWLIRSMWIMFLALLQILLVAFLAPNILLIGLLERIYPRFFEIKWVKETYVYPTMHLLMTKQFWPTLATGFREWKAESMQTPAGPTDESRPLPHGNGSKLSGEGG
jgi:hypothetical protein